MALLTLRSATTWMALLTLKSSTIVGYTLKLRLKCNLEKWTHPVHCHRPAVALRVRRRRLGTLSGAAAAARAHAHDAASLDSLSDAGCIFYGVSPRGLLAGAWAVARAPMPEPGASRAVCHQSTLQLLQQRAFLSHSATAGCQLIPPVQAKDLTGWHRRRHCRYVSSMIPSASNH